MSRPRIQLLLPFFGDPELLFETVNSIRAQDDPGWTLLVVDDAHPDERVSQWFNSAPDPRIEYIQNETRLGANGNYRRALSLAREDFVVMMGADDRLLPGYVARARTLLERHSPDILQPGVTVVDQAGAPDLPLGDRVKRAMAPHHRSPLMLHGEGVVTSLLRGNWTYFPSLVWRRELVMRAGLRQFEVVQDLALLVDLLLDGATLLVDQLVTFEYRRHSGSDSSVKALTGARFAEEATYYRVIADELERQGWDRGAAAARARWASRLHALALVPKAMVRGGDTRALLHHALDGLVRLRSRG